jgi:hypothetical protein
MDETRKVCMDCFNKMFPHKMPSIFTGGRVCSECKRTMGSRELSIKIVTDSPQDVGVVPVDMRHKL